MTFDVVFKLCVRNQRRWLARARRDREAAHELAFLRTRIKRGDEKPDRVTTPNWGFL